MIWLNINMENEKIKPVRLTIDSTRGKAGVSVGVRSCALFVLSIDGSFLTTPYVVDLPSTADRLWSVSWFSNRKTWIQLAEPLRAAVIDCENGEIRFV